MLMEVSQNQAAAHLFAQATVSLSEFSTLLGNIYQGPMEQVPWGKALEQIRRQLNANYCTLILRSPATDRPGLMINASEHGSTLPGETSYNNYYYALDPFIGLPSDRVVTIDEHLGPGAGARASSTSSSSRTSASAISLARTCVPMTASNAASAFAASMTAATSPPRTRRCAPRCCPT